MEAVWAILVVVGIMFIDSRLAKILQVLKDIREDLEYINSKDIKPKSD